MCRIELLKDLVSNFHRKILCWLVISPPWTYLLISPAEEGWIVKFLAHKSINWTNTNLVWNSRLDSTRNVQACHMIILAAPFKTRIWIAPTTLLRRLWSGKMHYTTLSWYRNKVMRQSLFQFLLWGRYFFYVLFSGNTKRCLSV